MRSEDGWWDAAIAATQGSGRLSAVATRRLGWNLVRDDLLAAGEPLLTLAAGQGFVISRAQALAHGVEDVAIRRLVRRAKWTAPRRGVLCPLPASGGNRPDGLAPEIVSAAVALLRPHCVVSHQSAAELDGIAVLQGAPRTRLTTASVSRAGGWPGCHVHAAPVPSVERRTWFGVGVTAPARTVVDLARHDGVAAGLVAADSALLEGACTLGELASSVRRARRRPGVVAAARVRELAAVGAESPLESLTRLCLVDGGITDIAELQATIPTPRATYRVDLLYRQRRVIVEADGRVKYRDPDALWREKLRQEALERVGFRVVRVTWSDVVHHPEQTVWRVRRAMFRTDVSATVGPF